MSKAKSALNKIKNLDLNVVAPLAEGRFATVADRLAWLEDQAAKLKASNSIPIDLSQGIFDGTEFVGGQLRLKCLGENQYVTSGTWESPIIDLTSDWIDTTRVNITNIVPSGASCVLEVASSTDGVTFSNYSTYDPANIPQTRYLKFRVTLTAPVTSSTSTTLEFNNSDPQNTFTLDSNTVADGALHLKTSYTFTMTDEGAVGAGHMFSQVLDKTAFSSIEKVSVN